MRIRLLIVTLLVALSLRAASAGEAGAGEAAGSEVTHAMGYLTEQEVLDALGEGLMGDCFLDTLNVDETDQCTYIIGPVTFEMVCVRCDMNTPMAFIEGSDRQGLMSLQSQQLENQMQQLNKNQSPLEKTMVQRVGDMVSASATTQGRCINMFLTASAIKQVLTGITFNILCSPAFEYSRVPYGYAFASEGDHMNGTEFGNWRSIISNYWFVPWLTPFTAISRTIEIPGLCIVDWFKLFCHGAWGTVYPSTGVNPAESQTMNLVESAFDSLNPTYAVFMTYGPLHLRMGSMLTTSAHEQVSYQYGSTAMHAQMTRGGYIQPLYPTTKDDCINTENVTADVDPEMEVWMPAVGAKTLSENNSNQVSDGPKYSDQGRNIAAALWPRFTCCNWCAGSYMAAYKHFIVGEGFWPQLINDTD